MRALRASFPEAEITASDIDGDAVGFCASLFGATPVLVSPDASNVRLAGDFDLIGSGSLLTHLDADR
jgi:hypothetical protein